MEKQVLEEAYWRILGEVAHVSDVKSPSSFTLMDIDAWIWSVRMYKLILGDYCKNLPFGKDTLRQLIVKTNHMLSKHDQARKILTLLGTADEAQEGWWLKNFRYELDRASGKGENLDKRSFTSSERPKFLEKVQELAQKVEFTSIILGLALIATIRNSDGKRVEKVLEVLPNKAEEFFLPKSHIL